MEINDISRRSFLKLASGTILAGASLIHSSKLFAKNSNIKAIAFDAFPIFDPRSIFQLAASLYPAQGPQFAKLWRTRIFEYTWLRTSARQYRDFWECIDDALQFTANQLKINLTTENHQRLMDSFLNLKCYSDVIPSLEKLRSHGIKLAFLSNMTDRMLHSNISKNGLEKYFDHIISTDTIRSYKPDPLAYQLGLNKLQVKKEEIVFVAFASWDAVGAKWYGYPTVWVNRLNFTAEKLDAFPDQTGSDLSALTNFIHI